MMNTLSHVQSWRCSGYDGESDLDEDTSFDIFEGNLPLI